MAVWGLLPSLSISLPSCFGATTTRTTANNFFSRCCFTHRVLVDEDEPEEALINSFRREVLKAGVLQECRRRRFFETPQDKIKRKAREASKRNRRRRRPHWRNPAQNKQEFPDNKNDDEEDDNWELAAADADVELPYS